MRNGTVLAFDFGLKRIGVAVGDMALRIPHPLETIDQVGGEQRFAAITKLIQEWQPALLVVGQPRHINGDEHAFAQTARKFGRRLEREFHVKTEFIDERWSSSSAESMLKESGARKTKHKQVLDCVAAQEILRTYFSMASDAAT